MGISMRRIAEEDLSKISVIHWECFNKKPYDALTFEDAEEDLRKKYADSDKENNLVVIKNGEIVGYLITKRDKDRFAFGPLGVVEKERGSKLGLVMLMSKVCELEEKGFSFFLLRINNKAVHLIEYYKKVGFEKVKEDERYFLMKLNDRKIKGKGIKWRKELFGGVMKYKGKYFFIDHKLRKDLELWNASKKLVCSEELNEFLKTGKSNSNEVYEINFPLKIRLEITGKCNNRCLWCYAKSRYESESLTTDEFKDIINYLAKEGLFEITFSGGEPTLNSFLPDLAKHSEDLNMETHLITNGTLLTEDLVNKLEKAGLRTMQISVEGVGEEHDRITKNRCFKDVETGLKNALKSRIKIVTNTTISKANKDSFVNTLDFLRGTGVKIANLNRCETDDVSLKLSKEDTEKVMAIASSENRDNFKVNWLQVIKKCDIDVSKYFKAKTCSACNVSITISPNGDIRPCSFSETRVGNVKKNKIRDIWNSSFFIKFRKNEIVRKECEGCKELEKCRGGCKLDLLTEIA